MDNPYELLPMLSILIALALYFYLTKDMENTPEDEHMTWDN